MTFKSKRNLKIDSPNVLVESNYLTMAATSQALLYGGSDCSIYCEGNPVETASGQDPIIASGVINKVLTMLKNARALFISGA